MAGMKNDFRSQFRLPGPLYDRLKESAEREGRSLNAEIVARLEASFQPGVRETLAELLDEQTRVLLEEISKARKGDG
jgi:predicted component of type VI protein secretion system